MTGASGSGSGSRLPPPPPAPGGSRLSSLKTSLNGGGTSASASPQPPSQPQSRIPPRRPSGATSLPTASPSPSASPSLSSSTSKFTSGTFHPSPTATATATVPPPSTPTPTPTTTNEFTSLLRHISQIQEIQSRTSRSSYTPSFEGISDEDARSAELKWRDDQQKLWQGRESQLDHVYSLMGAKAEALLKACVKSVQSGGGLVLNAQSGAAGGDENRFKAVESGLVNNKEELGRAQSSLVSQRDAIKRIERALKDKLGVDSSDFLVLGNRCNSLESLLQAIESNRMEDKKVWEEEREKKKENDRVRDSHLENTFEDKLDQLEKKMEDRFKLTLEKFEKKEEELREEKKVLGEKLERLEESNEELRKKIQELESKPLSLPPPPFSTSTSSPTTLSLSSDIDILSQQIFGKPLERRPKTEGEKSLIEELKGTRDVLRGIAGTIESVAQKVGTYEKSRDEEVIKANEEKVKVDQKISTLSTNIQTILQQCRDLLQPIQELKGTDKDLQALKLSFETFKSQLLTFQQQTSSTLSTLFTPPPPTPTPVTSPLFESRLTSLEPELETLKSTMLTLSTPTTFSTLLESRIKPLEDGLRTIQNALPSLASLREALPALSRLSSSPSSNPTSTPTPTPTPTTPSEIQQLKKDLDSVRSTLQTLSTNTSSSSSSSSSVSSTEFSTLKSDLSSLQQRVTTSNSSILTGFELLRNEVGRVRTTIEIFAKKLEEDNSGPKLDEKKFEEELVGLRGSLKVLTEMSSKNSTVDFPTMKKTISNLQNQLESTKDELGNKVNTLTTTVTSISNTTKSFREEFDTLKNSRSTMDSSLESLLETHKSFQNLVKEGLNEVKKEIERVDQELKKEVEKRGVEGDFVLRGEVKEMKAKYEKIHGNLKPVLGFLMKLSPELQAVAQLFKQANPGFRHPDVGPPTPPTETS